MYRQTDLRQRTYKEAKAEIPYDLQKLKRTETETETITGFRDDESSLRYSSSKKVLKFASRIFLNPMGMETLKFFSAGLQLAKIPPVQSYYSAGKLRRDASTYSHGIKYRHPNYRRNMFS